MAAVPLNVTVFDAAEELKFCPWMVTVVPTPPDCGVKLRMTSAVDAGAVVRVIWIMLPTKS